MFVCVSKRWSIWWMCTGLPALQPWPRPSRWVVLNSFEATDHQPNKYSVVDHLDLDKDKLSTHNKHFGMTYIVSETEFQEIVWNNS